MLATNSIIVVLLHYFTIVNWHTHTILLHEFILPPTETTYEFYIARLIILPMTTPPPTQTHIRSRWDKVSHHCLSLMSLIRVYIVLNMCLYHKDKKDSSSHGPAKTTLASLTNDIALLHSLDKMPPIKWRQSEFFPVSLMTSGNWNVFFNLNIFFKKKLLVFCEITKILKFKSNWNQEKKTAAFGDKSKKYSNFYIHTGSDQMMFQ